MFGRQALVERRCESCGTTWLLTRFQAHYSPHRSFGPAMAAPANVAEAQMAADVLHQAAGQMGADTDAALAVRQTLRTCPKCSSHQVHDRRITRGHPASPDALRTMLS